MKILACKSQDTFYASFHWSTTFTFAPGFVANCTIHTIWDYIIVAGQIIHRIPTVSNWNLWFCQLKSVWLQANIFKVSYSFDSWHHARKRQRFAGGRFAKSDYQKIELGFIAYGVSW